MTTREAATQPQATPTGPDTQAQPDLGSLVDQLIAARQASHAAQVAAHVAHADFGRIDLSFAADGAALTVGMRSHDPGFAPSVQTAVSAATPAGAGTDSRDPGSQPGAQTSGNASPQGSAREQSGPAPRAQDSALPSGGNPRAPGTDRGEDPRGVYA